MEDILYGVHAKTRSEMGATMLFMDRNPLDCDVLSVLDSGSKQDPFRQLSIKYLLAETFGDTRVVNDRDVCVLESMGFGHDSRGQRYGYYLLRSVDVPECSPLPEDSGVVRASITMCCIYRQAQGSVKVYSKASIDLGGSLPAFMANDAATEILLSTAEATASATSSVSLLSRSRTSSIGRPRSPKTSRPRPSRSCCSPALDAHSRTTFAVPSPSPQWSRLVPMTSARRPSRCPSNPVVYAARSPRWPSSCAPHTAIAAYAASASAPSAASSRN